MLIGSRMWNDELCDTDDLQHSFVCEMRALSPSFLMCLKLQNIACSRKPHSRYRDLSLSVALRGLSHITSVWASLSCTFCTVATTKRLVWVDEEMTFTNAQGYCRAQDGNLQSLHSLRRSRQLMEFALASAPGTTTTNVWIGANDLSNTAVRSG